MLRIEVLHLDGNWHKPGALATWDGGQWVYPTFATREAAQAAIDATYSDVPAYAVRILRNDKPLTLQGPRGSMPNGEICANSRFIRDDVRQVWQWVALDPRDNVLMVVEMPFQMAPFHNGSSGALWTCRDIADTHVSKNAHSRAHANS
jgi:hypothetical protein